MGVLPSISGLSWLGVLVTSRLPSLLATTHDQPEPKRPAPALLTASLRPSTPPNLLLIASASAPLGAPPPLGPMICQNMLWLACPPPLLRTAVRLSSGTLSRFW